MTNFLLKLIDGVSVMIIAVILKLKEKKILQKPKHFRNENHCLFLFIVKTYYIYMNKKSEILKLLPKHLSKELTNANIHLNKN